MIYTKKTKPAIFSVQIYQAKQKGLILKAFKISPLYKIQQIFVVII